MLTRHLVRCGRLAVLTAALLALIACDPEARPEAGRPAGAPEGKTSPQRGMPPGASATLGPSGSAGSLGPAVIQAPLRSFRGRIGIDISDISVNRTHFLDTPWSVWHAFRRHFDPLTGAPVSADEPVPGAMVPIPATVEISYLYGDEPAALCPRVSVQSDRDGFYRFTLPDCASYGPYRVPDLILARVVLRYEVRGPLRRWERSQATLGTIRGTWDDAKGQELYPTQSGPVIYTGQRDGETIEYVHPAFTRAYYPNQLPQPLGGPEIDLGVRDLRLEFSSAAEGSLSQTLSSWQKLVELHHRLHTEFLAVDDVPAYQEMFRDHAGSGCSGCYTVEYDSPTSSSYGGWGIMLLAPPRPDIVWGEGLHPVTHEFGHGIHAALARSSYGASLVDSAFASRKMDGDGNLSGSSHHAHQHQEMGTAFVEGVATALGDYLVHGCEAPWREQWVNWGPPPSNDQTLNPAKCANGAPCNFRWQMSERGIAEGSSAWEARWQLATAAHGTYIALGNVTNGALRHITSNSEGRYAQFACDLLRGDGDIDHDTGERAGMPYPLDGYVYLAGKAHDGVAASHSVLAYADDVQPKTFQLSLPRLLQALDSFFDGMDPQPAMGEPGYPERRLSLEGDLSPQTLGLYLLDRGWLTRGELNNVLRANYMQEATWPSPNQGLFVVGSDDDSAGGARMLEQLPETAPPRGLVPEWLVELHAD